MWRSAKQLWPLLLGAVLLSLTPAQGSPDFFVKLDHLTLVVKDLGQSASLFSKQGFTLKVPHSYKSGFQAGLTAQAIRLASGQYLQLMAIDKEQGALAKWYAKQLKRGEGGVTFILEHSHPKELCQLLKSEKIACQFQDLPQYQWVSFKTSSPYHPLAFIKYKVKPNISQELITHQNQINEIHKIVIAPGGDPKVWAKILTVAGARGSGIEFSGRSYSPSPDFASIQKIFFKGKGQKENFKIGATEIVLE